MHEAPGASAFAFPFATHASAWHGVAGAQSASTLHVSSETTGLQSEHPHSGIGIRVMLGPGPFSVATAGGPASDSSAATFAGCPCSAVGAFTVDGPAQATPNTKEPAEMNAQIDVLDRAR